MFLTGSGKSLSRRQIWAEMKRLCVWAGVEPSKVFPHNLRHLFATAYYRAYRDIAKLADVLGHSSIETTRIYLLTSGAEHQRQLDRLGLVS
ncbi:MAG: tyrosine-type recombinase/integrase [Oscillospiraceae bacterium]